jgi:hypothetical protein
MPQRVLDWFREPYQIKDWPAAEKSWVGRSVEYPEDAKRVRRVAEMGPFSRFRYKDAYAATGPFGTIYLNRPLIEKENADLDSIFSHELTHAGQGLGGFWRSLIGDKSVENEAINREAFRPPKQDVLLRVPRKPKK